MHLLYFASILIVCIFFVSTFHCIEFAICIRFSSPLLCIYFIICRMHLPCIHSLNRKCYPLIFHALLIYLPGRYLSLHIDFAMYLLYFAFFFVYVTALYLLFIALNFLCAYAFRLPNFVFIIVCQIQLYYVSTLVYLLLVQFSFLY